MGAVLGHLELTRMTQGANQICINHDVSPAIVVDLSSLRGQCGGEVIVWSDS